METQKKQFVPTQKNSDLFNVLEPISIIQ